MQLTRGYIACSIVTTGPNNYQDQQLQQWGWTNSPPIQITTSNQPFTATWSVTGGGLKLVVEMSQNYMKTDALAWTENGSLPVQLQVRISSNNQVLLTNASSITLQGGLTGTQTITIDGVIKPSTMIVGPVDGLALPAVQWNGAQYTRRLPDGSEQPGPVASQSKSRTGSLLGLNLWLPYANSYAGSQQLPNPRPSGLQAPAGSMSTATWRWRIYY